MNPETIDLLWRKARKADGFPENIIRLDICGALIMRSKFEDTSSPFGWTVDHVYPISRGGGDEIDNLRPMQWQNALSKGDDFPVYFAGMKASGHDNQPCSRQMRVSKSLYATLKELYGFDD